MRTGAHHRKRAVPPVRSHGRHGRHRPYRAQSLAMVVLSLLGMVLLVRPDAASGSDLAARVGGAAPSVTATPTAAPAPAPAPTTAPAAIPTVEAPLPKATSKARQSKLNVTRSTGRLSVVPGRAKATRAGGRLTYRIEIEDGLSFNGAQVAAAVHRTLTDRRGWQAIHPVAFERTDSPDVDLRIIVATPTLTDRLCRPLDTGGEVSCRVDDRVVLNAKRWMYAVPAYGGQVDLYRSYLVNHEVGHALGHGHSTCAKAKTPAPVMMQQTKGLVGCRPNAWPTIKAT